MECTHCNKQFSTKGSLTTHQKTAKYCLERQSKQNNDFGCTFCHKTFTLQHVLNDHLTVCKEKHKQEIIIGKDMIILQNKNEFDLKSKYYMDKLTEKDDYILKLESSNQKYEEKLEKQKIEYETKLAQQKTEYEIKLEKFENAIIASVTQSKTPAKSAPTTNNTTNLITVTNNNFLNLSQEHIKKVLAEKLDFNVVYAGQAGLAKFVVDYMLTDEDGNVIYHCVDPSRQTFEFIDEKGEKVRDVKAEKLIQSLLKGDVIRLGLEQAAKGWNTDDNSLNLERTTVFGPKVSEYAELNRNNTVFRSKVSSLTA